MGICIHGQEVLGMAPIRVLGKGSARICAVRQRPLFFFGHRPRSSSARRGNGAGQSYGQSYFSLLKVIFGCVSTEISIGLSTRFLPNRIEDSVC